MAGYRLSRPAQRDLDNIWLHIAEDNPSAADDFLDLLYEKFLLLASMPRMGRERRDLAPVLRSFSVHRYVVFYRVGNRIVDAVRVIHGARDVDSQFGA